LLGGIAIAVGVATYSKKVIATVGEGLMSLSPAAALVAVWAHSIVLFLFSSKGLQEFLAGAGLPALPLVPVSSTQAIIGAVMGIGLLKGGHGIRRGVAGRIAFGWVVTPVIAALVCFISLFFLENVFHQRVFL
jgi:PiT family inorganic phosphate transporter